MKNIILISLIILAFLLISFLEGRDLEQTIKHNNSTYCELKTCYEANNHIIYEFEKTKIK